MIDLRDLGINLLATGIAFALGVALRSLVHYAGARRARRFWRTIARGKVIVFQGSFPQFAYFEPTGLTGVGDTRAVHELITHLTALGISPVTAYSNRLQDRQAEEDLVLVGAEDVNELAQEIVKLVHADLRFVHGERLSLRDERDRITFTPQWEDGKIKTDYGLLIRTANPFHPARTVVVIAGVYGFATWAGVRLLSSDELLKDFNRLEDFVCLYRANVIQGYPHKTEPVILREIVHGRLNPSCPSDCSLRR